MFQTIRTVAGLTRAAVSGGATAFVGALAAFGADASANIVTTVLDYAWFNAEEGIFKDIPESKNESVAKRIWRIVK